MAQLEEILPDEAPVVGSSEVRPSFVRRHWLGIGLCALSGMSYGGQAILAKWAYGQGVNVTSLLTVRLTVASLAIWLLVAITRPDMRLSRRQRVGLAVLGLNFIGSTGMYYLSLNMLGASTAALLGNTYPIWVVLWMVLFFHERFDQLRSLALGMAVLGAVLTVDPVAVVTTGERFSWIGAILAVGSALSNSVYIIFSGRIGRGIPGLVVAAWSTPFTALAYIIWCLVSGEFQWDMSGTGWLLCIGVGIATGVAVGLYQAGIQLIGSSRAAITATTEPATTVLLAIVLLGEPASPIKLGGGLLIIWAIVLLSRPDGGRGSGDQGAGISS